MQEFTELKVLVSFTAVLLASCATTPDLPSGSAPIGLVFDQILVETFVQDRGPYTCMVDSGAAVSGVSRGLSSELRMNLGERTGAMKVALPGGPPDTVGAVEKDLGPISREIARPVHCVLGQDWLALRVVEIDYPRRLLTTAPTSPRPLCREFRMRFAHDRMPLVDVMVNGQLIPLAIDTGEEFPIRLTPEGSRRAAVEGMGAGGKPDRLKMAADMGRGIVRTLEMGPIAMNNVNVIVRDPKGGEPSGSEVGALGNGFFKAGVLTLDYPAQRVRVCAART